ncbi:MAG: penicillin-binding protein 1A, partial [Pseudomonadota bacterium]|nr:penicillin-binding protein 1A [Pseudomonadota bacterium]
YATGHRPVGASTITQQVAKNFLLSGEVSYTRKIREAILSFRIEKAFTKDRILELYLNEIFLGNRSYGVAAAAVSWFNKSLDELTVAEAAYLAALPKAPNSYHPVRNRDAAYARRNWVIGEMRDNGYITAEETKAAMAEEILLRPRTAEERVAAGDFAEEVRRELVAAYGEEPLYRGGYSVRTTVDPRLQEIATQALRQGLMAYDRRHGWRGPVAKLQTMLDWSGSLAGIATPAGSEGWILAVVLDVTDRDVDIGFADKSRGRIPLTEMKWARAWRPREYLGPEVKKPSDVMAQGDVILVEAADKDSTGKKYPSGTWTLRQVPQVQGGLVAMDPHTGRVLALSSGFSSSMSVFNRATQALRQPGSSFKPFIYLAALEHGFTPSSLILDAPVVIEQGPGLPLWKPQNYSGDFMGPTTLRRGIEKSRNLMTVRLAQSLGMPVVADYAERFGITPDLQETLSMALGAGETTVLRLTTAYAMLVNGGKKITPTLIDRIQDQQGKTVYRHDNRPCTSCQSVAWSDRLPTPDVPDTREQVTDPRAAAQMVSILEGVIQRGTGQIIASLNRPLAGKTGTTNDSRDAWFVGFSPDLAIGVYVGFDTPRDLGPKETGGSVSAPIFRQFMGAALANQPPTPFRRPSGIRLVRINPETGLLAQAGETGTIWESFIPGTEPGSESSPVLDGLTGSTGEGSTNPFLAPTPQVEGVY